MFRMCYYNCCNCNGVLESKLRSRLFCCRASLPMWVVMQLQRLHAPVGVDLGAHYPEEIALATMAEIVARRHIVKANSSPPVLVPRQPS